MNQVQNRLKPMNIGDILDYSVEAFKQNFKGIFLLSLILYVPWIVLDSIIENIFIGSPMSEYFSLYKDFFNDVLSQNVLEGYMEEPNISTYNPLIAALFSLFQLIYSLTFKLVLNAAVIKMIYDYAISGEVKIKTLADVKAIIKDSFKFLPNMMGNAVMFVIILVSVYFISIIAGVFVIMIPTALLAPLTGSNPVYLGVVVILLSIFVIFGVLITIGFFAVKLIFGANTIVIEGKSAFESIRRSFYLAKGKFWHIGFTCVFAFMLYYLFGSMLVGASMFLELINKTLYIVVNAFSRMCAAITETFILVFITILFVNMKIQKEGLDIEVKMRKLIENENKA